MLPLQITAIIFLPNFPGWLAPLAFNPIRFLEFFSFAATLLGTWVATGGCCCLKSLSALAWAGEAGSVPRRQRVRAAALPLFLQRLPCTGSQVDAELLHNQARDTAHMALLPLQACSLEATDLPPRQTCRQHSGKQGIGCVHSAACACVHPVLPAVWPLGHSPPPRLASQPAVHGANSPPLPCSLLPLDHATPAAVPAACGSSACQWRPPSWCC